MKASKCIESGNVIVDKVAKIQLKGNIVETTWYHTIVNEKNKTQPLAILILAEIVYWYRPVTDTGKPKFYGDFLQLSYDQIAKKFGVSKKQVRAATDVLENLGVIKKYFRTISGPGGRCSNVLFIELIPDVLDKLSHPEEIGVSKNVDTPYTDGIDLSSVADNGISQKVDTNTKTTKEITKETTTTDVGGVDACSFESFDAETKTADEIRSIFADYDFSDGNIKALEDAAGGDLDKIRHAKNVLDGQAGQIGNVVGWLISAIKNHYEAPISKERKAGKDNGDILNHGLSDSAIKGIESALLKQD